MGQERTCPIASQWTEAPAVLFASGRLLVQEQNWELIEEDSWRPIMAIIEAIAACCWLNYLELAVC